ncbi:addiction module antidote protein [Rhizobium binxianense]
MENFSPYDAAEYLESEEDFAGFLNAVMEDGGDVSASVGRALGVVARARMLTQLASDAGISRRELVGVFSGEIPANAETTAKLAQALGLDLGSAKSHT